MNRLWKLVGGLLGVVLVGIALWWGGSRRAQPGSQPSGDTFETPPVPTAQTPAKTGNSSFFRRLSKNRATASLTNEVALSATSTNLIVQWEARVDGVLTSDGKEADKESDLELNAECEAPRPIRLQIALITFFTLSQCFH